jgi:hypothetical protein
VNTFVPAHLPAKRTVNVTNTAAEADREHAFAAKFRLYDSSRWLLGVAGANCFLF